MWLGQYSRVWGQSDEAENKRREIKSNPSPSSSQPPCTPLCIRAITMVHVALVAVFVLLNTAAGAPPKHDTEDRLPVSLVADDTQTANASLVENFLDPPVPALEDPGFFGPHSVGNNPNQWRMPDIFKRQAACYNYCGPTQSAPTLYCGCGQGCCSTRCCTTSKGEACCGVNPIFCCNTAAGSLCCATQCCINGATCNGNRVCAFRT